MGKKYIIDEDTLVSWANEIRTATDTSNKYTPTQMISKIKSINGSAVDVLKLFSNGGGVDNPTKADYVSDLNNKKTALAETLQNAGVEVFTDETLSTLIPTACEKIEESADSYYDTFWDAFQQYGERTNYEQAFNCQYGVFWTADSLKPKYKLTITNANSMFKGVLLTDVSYLFEDNECDFVLHPITGTLATAGYMFSGCVNLINAPTIDVNNVSTIINFFNGCTSLKTVNIKNISKELTILNAFINCQALTNVLLTGEIGSNISFKNSPLLSDASIQNIIDCLADLTGGTAQTLTVHSAVYEKIVANDELYKSIFNKNWDLR